MSKECGRDDAQYTVCIGHVAAVVPIKALYSAWLPCQGDWKAFKLVWFPPSILDQFSQFLGAGTFSQKSHEYDKGKQSWGWAMHHNTPMYVLVQCSRSSSAKHYILINCLAHVAENLSNRTALIQCLLLDFPSLFVFWLK